MLKNKLDYLSASFISEQTELLYRNTFLVSDRRQVIIGLLLICIPSAVFIYSDYVLFGYSAKFYSLLSVRCAIIILVCFNVVLVLKLKSIRAKDNLVFTTIMLLACAILYINLSRPANYFQHATTDILIVFSLYWIIPNRYILQIIPAVTISLFNIYIFVFHKDNPNSLVATIFWFSYAFVNIIGLWTSRNMHIYRRRQFATQLEQVTLTEKLQLANDEIRTLQGILPLCSGCKKIRDGKGYWSQLDAYIEANTDTQFSHGMCAGCIETLYGEQEWYKHSKNKPSDFTRFSS